MGKYPQHSTDYTQSSTNGIGFNSAPWFYSSSSKDAEGGREKGFMRKDNELSISHIACEEAMGFLVSYLWRTAGEGLNDSGGPGPRARNMPYCCGRKGLTHAYGSYWMNFSIVLKFGQHLESLRVEEVTKEVAEDKHLNCGMDN